MDDLTRSIDRQKNTCNQLYLINWQRKSFPSIDFYLSFLQTSKALIQSKMKTKSGNLTKISLAQSVKVYYQCSILLQPQFPNLTN